MENDKIRVLPDGVANQIAAGEVVGRPASVVKELMENAVDAGSTVVTVNYRDGGKSLIQVVDNGCGMSDTDARLAFERHATSKIRSADDLYRLHSFGFRGEALPSIASVAEVELRTRTPYGELGTKVCIHGGRFQSQEPVQMPQGTQFSVKNLFYNTPARRRFLKEASVEARHIRTEFQRVALCNPGIAFTLCDGDAPLVQLPATNLRQRIVSAVGGREIAKNLLEVSVDTSMVRVEGFVGRPSAAKKTNREQFLFVNGRYFQSSYFRKAVLQAYDKLIPSDTQPSYFLYITIDPERIDVNVHPQKTEIRFDDEQALWQIFNAAVREALGKTGVVPLMDFEIDPSIDIPVARKGVIYREPDLGVDPSFNPFDEERKTSGADRPFPAYGRGRESRDRVNDWEQLYEVDSQAIFPTDKIGETGADRLVEFDSDELEYIEGGGSGAAQAAFDWEAEPVTGEVLMLGGRYCATRLREGLAVVDLPRAWERVRYERYLGMLGNETSATQRLLFAETVPLSAAEACIAREIAGDLEAVGFDFRIGEESMTVTGIPADLPDVGVGQAVREMLSEFRESERLSPDDRIRRTAAVMARCGAMTSRDAMDADAARELLREWLRCEGFNYTPDGRPVMTVLTVEELAKRLK